MCGARRCRVLPLLLPAAAAAAAIVLGVAWGDPGAADRVSAPEYVSEPVAPTERRESTSAIDGMTVAVRECAVEIADPEHSLTIVRPASAFSHVWRTPGGP